MAGKRNEREIQRHRNAANKEDGYDNSNYQVETVRALTSINDEQ